MRSFDWKFFGLCCGGILAAVGLAVWVHPVAGVLAGAAIAALGIAGNASTLKDSIDVVGEFREGRYDKRIDPVPGGEVGDLATALNALGEEWSTRTQGLTPEEAQLRAMLAGMVEGVIALDDQDRVLFSNKAARRLFGVEELKGRKLWEAVRIAELDEVLRAAWKSDRAARGELKFIDANGQDLVLRAKAHHYRSEDIDGVVIVLDDISEVRRLERFRRDFVANVSHELKTPLTSIRGYVETLLDGAIEDTTHNVRFLEKIETNVDRLNHLVLDLLSLARIEEEEGSLELSDIDLSKVVEEARARHEEQATGKDIVLSVQAEGSLPLVKGDDESLVQVLDNLIDNAIKYTHGGGEVTLSLSTEGDHVLLAVTDNGVGIPPEDLERIFERFYRVDKARSFEVGGTGLGLSIVKHLVLAMGGEVSVTSEYGQGTTFRVQLNRA